MMGGTGGHTGGTEVCVGGRTGVGGESIASCINYTGKKPTRTHKIISYDGDHEMLIQIKRNGP